MQENPITSTDVTTEADLRARFGLTPKALAAIRFHQLLEGNHWKKRGREICYTPAGVDALQSLLAIAEKAGAVTTPEPGPQPPEPVSLTLLKTRLANARIVLAKKTDADPAADPPPQPLRVRVKTAVHLRPGMILPDCTPVDEAAGLWEFRGKLPRYPGKW